MYKIKQYLEDIYEQMRLRRTYCRFAKKNIIKIIANRDYDNLFLREIHYNYIVHTAEEMYRNIADPELKECVNYIIENGPAMYCYKTAKQKRYDDDDIFYDSDKALFYAYWDNKKMFFKRSLNNRKKVLDYLNISFWEQSDGSPHQYLSKEFSIEQGDVVLDIGAAEGNFTLSIIDQIEKAYLFECEPEWLEALKYTFADYREKICIVPQFVSDKDHEDETTIDAFCKKNHLDQIGMIKMDIEGAEIKALIGAKDMLRGKHIKKCAICVYHNIEDADKIEKLLHGYSKAYTDGYIMSAIWHLHDLKYPYWVKGVLRAELK